MRSSRWSSPALWALSAAAGLAVAAPAGAELQRGSLVVPIRSVDTGAVLIEGGLQYVTLRRLPERRLVLRRRLRARDTFALRRPLAPGRYRLVSWIRACQGNCDSLSPPTSACAGDLRVRAGKRTRVVLELSSA